MTAKPGPKRRPLQRLTSAAQFRLVLAQGTRLASANFLMRAMPNGMAVPRLGVIAAARIARRSVDRNRGKRLVRELLRLRANSAPLVPLDLVVQIRSDLRKFGSGVLRAELGKLLDKLDGLAAK